MCRSGAKSGDNIGHEHVFDRRDLVFEDELALLEPRELQLIDEAALLPGMGQRRDGRVEIAMFGLQESQFLAQFLLVHQPSFPNRIMCSAPPVALRRITNRYRRVSAKGPFATCLKYDLILFRVDSERSLRRASGRERRAANES